MSNQTIPKRLVYDKEYSADEVLDGKLKNRRPSPSVFYEINAVGFREDRLYSVPKAGIHPRILFGPDDLPRIRDRFEKTDAGRQILEFLRERVVASVNKEGTKENRLYNHLLNGDVKAFARLFEDRGISYAVNWPHRDSFRVSLMWKAFLSLVYSDPQEGKKAGKALRYYTDYMLPMLEEEEKKPNRAHYWRGARRVIDQHCEIAYIYDWAYNFMDEEDRVVVRQFIAKVIKDKFTIGMDLPSHWRMWNFIGIGLYFVNIALAIEGEEGYDRRIYDRGTEVVRDFLTYAHTRNGVGKESNGYHGAGLVHMMSVMTAMANRGDNYFTHPFLRNLVEKWFLWTMLPYGGEWISRGDLGNFAPSIEPVMVMRYFYPDNEIIDFVYQNTSCVRENNFKVPMFIDNVFFAIEDPKRDENGDLIDYEYGKRFGLPNTFADSQAGVMITRTGWSKDALDLHFECRSDTEFASHDHADRGSFTLAALGRKWIRDDRRLTESRDHSIVMIDGVGQGHFAPAGRWLGVVDSEMATFGICDAKYCYDWRWYKEFLMWDPEDPRLKEDCYKWMKEQIIKFRQEVDLSKVEYDPSPHVVEFYKDYLDGNPLLWNGEDSWVIRYPHNPVKKAFRTAGIVRGEKPYVLIVDDIQKDEDEHLYEWTLALDRDVMLQRVEDKAEYLDVILREVRGDRRLLVRVLQTNNSDKKLRPYWQLYSDGMRDEYPVSKLIVPSKCVAPDFKVLILPYVDGDRVPDASYDKGNGRLIIRWQDREDIVRFKQDESGRTVFDIDVNGVRTLSIK